MYVICDAAKSKLQRVFLIVERWSTITDWEMYYRVNEIGFGIKKNEYETTWCKFQQKNIFSA
jgi:hypothetical protein